MRKGLIVLLGLGVIAGYGSALGHMRHRTNGGGYGGHECGSWSRYEGYNDERAVAPVVAAPVAPAPAPVQQQAPQMVVPQIIIVQPQAAPAANAPTIIYQPAPAPAPKAEQPAAKPTGAE